VLKDAFPGPFYCYLFEHLLQNKSSGDISTKNQKSFQTALTSLLYTCVYAYTWITFVAHFF